MQNKWFNLSVEETSKQLETNMEKRFIKRAG